MHSNSILFRDNIAAAKKGDKAALRMCLLVLQEIANGEGVPDEAIIAMCECALSLGMEQSRKDAEKN